MIVTKLDVTFDPVDAIRYYKEVELTCPQLKWTMPDNVYFETIKDIYGWSLDVPSNVDPELPYGLYRTIELMGKENYQETKAAFGFGKSLMDMFPMAYRFAVGVTPPGVYAPPHSDTDEKRDALRGWIPFINNPTIKWITAEGVADLQPGNVYIIDISCEHEFINEGTEDGVGMVFDIHRHDFDRVKQITGRLA